MLAAFGSFGSVKDSISESAAIIPGMPIEIAGFVGGAFAGTFASGTGLINSMSEGDKILSDKPLFEFPADVSCCKSFWSWVLAALNAATTGFSAFNGLKIVLGGLISSPVVLDISGGYFALNVFLSSTIFNAKKQLENTSKPVELHTQKGYFKFLTTTVISFITNGSMSAYQTALLLTSLGLATTAPATLSISLIMAIVSDINLYYSQMLSTKEQFAKNELTELKEKIARKMAKIREEDPEAGIPDFAPTAAQEPSYPLLLAAWNTHAGETYCDLSEPCISCPSIDIKALCAGISSLCRELVAAPLSTILKKLAHFLIDAAWVLTPLNSPATFKSLLTICTAIITELTTGSTSTGETWLARCVLWFINWRSIAWHSICCVPQSLSCRRGQRTCG